MEMKDAEEKAEGNTAVPEVYSIFTTRQKVLIVAIASIAATFSSFSANIYYPAIPTIGENLSVTPELINLTVTSYMIFQGLSPTIWGALADVQGRRVTYIVTFIIYFGACTGLAETKQFYQLLILRCLQSTGSASSIAIGSGVIGDITTRAERGGYMGIFQAGLLVPNAAGPIIGGAFNATLGWRAIFWFLAIYCGVFLVFLTLFLPETLRSKVGNGSIPATGLSKSPLSYFIRHKVIDTEAVQQIQAPATAPKSPGLDFLGPLRILFGIEVTCVIVFLSIYYTGWQMIISAMSTEFSLVYHLSELDIGFCFIGNGAGCIFGTLFAGRLLDYDYRRLKKLHTGASANFPLEKARFGTIWIWSLLQCASVLVWGWTVEKAVHISVPIICTFTLGWSTCCIQSIITTFLVDVFHTRSASAVASLNLARCLMGAGGTAVVLPIINRIGAGWAATLISGIMLLSLGLIGIQIRYGQQWRHKREERELEIEDS